MLLETSRPDYSRLGDYFGIWSIYEPAFNSLFDMVARMDLSQHVVASIDERKAAKALDVPFQANESALQVTESGVAIFDIRGTLMKAESSFSESTSTVAMRQRIRQARNSSQVIAAFFRFETPGGTVAGTQLFADEIAAFERVKPTAAHIEDMCASAGYWAASQCGLITTHATGIVGGIGTFMGVRDTSGMLEEMKIKVHLIKAGQFKGAGTPGTPVTDEQIAQWQAMVNSLNEQFVTAALISGRKMTAERAAAIADGRVHVGEEAKALGLVDAIQTAEETIQQLLERAGGGSSVKKGKTKMSNENTAPKAATLAELKAACIGASSDFLLAQLDAGATVASAQSNYIVAMKGETERLRQENETAKAAHSKALEDAANAKKELEDVQAGGKKRGVDPIISGGKSGAAAEDAFDGDPVALFNERRAALIAKGVAPFAATARVAKSDPKLHVAYQLATNHKSKAKELVRDMAETFEIAG